MRNKRVSGGAKAGSIIICVFMTFVLFTATTALILNRVFTQKFISSVISNISTVEIPVEIDGKEYDSVSDAMMGVIADSIDSSSTDVNIDVEDSDISEEAIEEFIAESGIEELLADKLGMGIEAIVAGEDVAILTEDDIMDFIDDNEELIEDTFEVEITEEMKDEIRTEIKDSGIEDSFTTGAVTEVLYEDESNPIAPLLNAIRNFFSTTMVIVCYAIVLIMFLGIFFLNKMQLWYAGPYLGISTLIVGAGTVISSLTSGSVAGAAAGEDSVEMVLSIIKPICDLMLTIGVIYILIGVVAIVVSSVVKRTLRNNELEEQKAQEFV